MTTTIWLARHGEVHNPRNVLYGRLPRMRLTAQGEREAQRLADYLSERPLSAIYSSPMLRARKTADVILSAHPALGRARLDTDLQEVLTGWQGEPVESLERINWDFYANPCHPGDESLQIIHDRMQRWLKRVLRRHAGGEVVAVSHGDPIQVLAGALQGVPLEQDRLFPRPYIHTGALYEAHFANDGTFVDVRLLPADLGQADVESDEAAA